MKSITLLLCFFIFICGCREMKYRKPFDSYGDSCTYYHDRFMCYILCHKNDSADIMYFNEHRCVDSMNKYYNLLHPNMANDKPKSETDNCNCK